MTYGHPPAPTRRHWFRDAAVTLAAVLLAFAALDDITTDTATNFTVEWMALAACAVWLIVVSRRLLRGEYRWIGAVSLIVLVAAVGA